MAQEPRIVPIPGNTKASRLAENVGAAVIDLTPQDQRGSAEALGRIKVQGDRYPPQMAARAGK